MRTAGENAQLSHRRTRVANLLLTLERPTVRRIAEILEQPKSNIQRDIQAIQAEWREERMRDLQEHKDRELAKINLLEQSAWTNLQRSEEERTKVVEESIPLTDDEGDPILDDEGDPLATVVKRTKTVEQREGTAAYMTVIQQCGRDRRQLLGLDKAPDFSQFSRVPVTLILGDNAPNGDTEAPPEEGFLDDADGEAGDPEIE